MLISIYIENENLESRFVCVFINRVYYFYVNLSNFKNLHSTQGNLHTTQIFRGFLIKKCEFISKKYKKCGFSQNFAYSANFQEIVYKFSIEKI